MKRLFSIALILALALTLAPVALAADSGVTVGSGVAGGTVVYVDMTGRTGDVVVGAGGVVSDSPASSMVTGSIAAINGGFFNSYYSGGGTSFPDNCPIIYGAITKNGEVINAGGANNAIAFTYDGKVLIDRVNVQVTAVVSGKANVSIYGVNKIYDDASSVTVMTDDLTLPFTAPAGSQVFTIQNDKVTAVAGPGTYTVPAGSKLLVYNSAAIANANTWEILPAVGDTVQFAYNYAPTRTADQADWDNVKTLVSGGRMLVQNSVNVTANTAYNAEFDSDPKQSNSGSALRSFAAVMGDGRLLLGTASGSFPQIANDLIALGAVNAVSLDGGASSMLYTGNNGFLTSAGRELASVLTIVPQNAAEVKPDNPDIPVIDSSPNNPSSWAAADVEQAKSLGLLPAWLLNNYRNPITREEFCDLIIQLIPARTGKTADQFRGELGIVGSAFDSVTFSDTSKYSIRLAAALGIVTGYDDGTFRPTASLTREQAATMLQRTAELMGTVSRSTAQSFSDSGSIGGWAREAVDFVTSCGIMNGKDGGRFDPKGTYTRDQAFITMLNTYNAVTPG